MYYYRICDDKGGKPMTLFHGIRGSRLIPLDRWIDAEVKTVHDGDRGKPYRSGFHVLKDEGMARRVLRETFKRLDGRVVVRVEASGIRPKKHSRHGVLLARRMRLSTRDWEGRKR